MAERAAVDDWMTDFDHLHSDWIKDPYPIWDRIRNSECPVAHTERYNGVYFPATWEAVRKISYDTDHFSSYYIVVRENRPEGTPGGEAPPITSDPPSHRSHRMLLLPPFSPKSIRQHEAKAREICQHLVAQLSGAGCDGSEDYAKHLPTLMMTHLLGLPESDSAKFRRWIHEILEVGILDRITMQRAVEELTRYFFDVIESRKAYPKDDLVNYLLTVEQEGRKLDDEQIVGILRLLLVAGIDTTWSAIGAALWHLATHQGDQERLRNEPSLTESAIEELLRVYAPVTMARVIKSNTVISGCTFLKGEMVLLSFPAANRDPAKFSEPNKVILDRPNNAHAAFGLGIHRCVGAHLARMELRIAIETFLQNVRRFRLDPLRSTEWSEGTVRGPRSLPLLFS